MSIIDQPWFSTISRPSRYLGNEFNAVKKDPARIEVSIALAFPDVYEVGMSHLGLKILYGILNETPWLAAERVFSPWTDLEAALRHEGAPLNSLETQRPLSQFDIIGFSLQHELAYTNVLTILDLSGIPFSASQRTEKDPLIIAGGPACFNPEPVAEFFDAVVVGDGETAALAICDAVRQKKQGAVTSKTALLHGLRHIQGVYIPVFFRFQGNTTGPSVSLTPLLSDYTHVNKAVLSRLDAYPYPTRQIVPCADLIHDRLAMEICRGCTRGCRFCQAGMIYRPVRERDPATVLADTKKALQATGYEELSLLSLSAGDYGCIEPLMEALMDRQSRDRIAVSLPSLRVDSLSPAMIAQIKRVRKTGFTLAAEAGNDLLRQKINKGLTQTDILNMARIVYGAGWHLIKLYFMVGLPFEQEKDIQDIVSLARQVAALAPNKGGRAKLNVSITTFVPKSHTPFMWAPQITLAESRRRILYIRDALHGSRIRVKWNQPELSWLEGLFSRGDRRLSRVIVRAWQLGARFDAWGDQFKKDRWDQAIAASGLDPDDYIHRQRSLYEALPWDHIRSGVHKQFLIHEWQRAEKGRPTPDCREGCLECGVCDHKTVDPVLSSEKCDLSRLVNPPKSRDAASPAYYRLTFSKTGRARYLSHLELVRMFVRAFKRAGLDMSYSQGFHPMPRISFADALPVGVESLEETLFITLNAPTAPESLYARINQQMPDGIAVTAVQQIQADQKKIRLKESAFLVTLPHGAITGADLRPFLEADHFPINKTNKKGMHEIDARPLVKSINLVSSHCLALVLRHPDGPKLKPQELVQGIIGSRTINMRDIQVVKTKQILC